MTSSRSATAWWFAFDHEDRPRFVARASDWADHLACEENFGTWTPQPGANETQPINCLGWYDAAAFCIWDGGFLPSEAERFYAAGGGAEQRVFPWSNPPSSTTVGNDDVATPLGQLVTAPVGSKPAGAGKYGQLDLAANVSEWVLDYLAPLPATCTDCAAFAAAEYHPSMGGNSWVVSTLPMQAAFRASVLPPGSEPICQRRAFDGVRCARSP